MTADRRQRGFTLLELIVAAGILALIAVFAWRGLDALIREREGIASSQAAIDVVQRAFARIERDALLANDAQLDDGGTLRLVAGTSSVDGTPAATVDYRLVQGTLVRSVSGGGRQVLLDGVTALSMEAWLPRAGGGAWVRSKPAASEPPRARPDAVGAAALPVGASAGQAAAVAAVGGVAGPGQPASGTSAAPALAGGTLPLVAAATGIRLAFERADGSRVVRAFMVGGA